MSIDRAKRPARRRVLLRGAASLLPLLLAAWALPAQPPAPKSPAAAPLAPADARVAELVRLWYYARLFDPVLNGREEDWDAALVAAVPAVRAAPDDAAFARIADAMLRPAGGNAYAMGPTPGMTQPAAAPAALPAAPPPAFRIESNAAVASCAAIARLAAPTPRLAPAPPGPAFDAAYAPVAAAAEAHGLVVDCRHVPGDATRYVATIAIKAWLASFVGARIERNLPNGGERQRFHDGYPPERGSTSGGYSEGVAITPLPPIRAAKAPGGTAKLPRLVLLADTTTPDPWELAGGLQAASLARVVTEGPVSGRAFYPVTLAHVRAIVPVSDYVRPDGGIGFRADACLPYGADDEGLRVALALLDPAAHGPACGSSEPAWPSADPGPAASADGTPAIGERVLALAKLWGAIDYFYPYKSLLDRPWDGELEAFLPAFLAADSRLAYETAVQGLAHRIEDSHVGVGGLRATRLARAGWAPPLYVRPVGGTFAVVALQDPSLSDRIRPGDEIVAVDGRPAAAIAAEIGAVASASTPQALAGYEASALTAGPQGSDARLTLRRAGAPPFDVVLKRSLPARAAGSRPADPRPAWRRLAPDIGYVDLERLAYPDADKAIDDLLSTKAIVFDLRGYPQGTAWAIAPRLALPGRDGAVAALFRRPHYLGPDEPTASFLSFEQRLPVSDKPHYRGRVIVLIDERAISQSEHTALFLEAAARPVFVGTPTTGANGDVTVIALPGGLYVPFTGHDVRHSDGRRLQRVGIQPDVRVAPTLAGLRAGRDEVLEAALKLARKP